MSNVNAVTFTIVVVRQALLVGIDRPRTSSGDSDAKIAGCSGSTPRG